MPIVPAKCTACGANLNVDSNKDAAVCNYCGSAFIIEKAINNYNNYNTINADKVVVEGIQVETLLKNAETYIKLGDFGRAQTYYTEMTKHFPDDYRGWWGSVRYFTRDFTAPCSSFYSYGGALTCFQYAMKLATDYEEKQAMAAKFKVSLQLMAQEDASSLASDINRGFSIRSGKEQRLQEEQKEKRGHTVSAWIFGIITVILVVLTIILFKSERIFFALLVGFVAFCTFGGGLMKQIGKKDACNKRIREYEAELAEFKITKASDMWNKLEADFDRINAIDPNISSENLDKTCFDICYKHRLKEAGLN